MSVTYTAGYNNIWTHLDRNPEEDLSGGYLVTSVTPNFRGSDCGCRHSRSAYRPYA